MAEDANKPMKVVDKDSFIAWAKARKDLSETEAMKYWNQTAEEFKKFGVTNEREMAQSTMSAVKKLPEVVSVRALVVGEVPPQDWTEIATKVAESRGMAGLMPWDSKVDKLVAGESPIPSEPRWQAGVYLFGYQVGADGSRMGEYAVYSLNATDNLNDENRAADAPMTTQVLMDAFKEKMCKVVDVKCGKSRGKGDVLVQNLYVIPAMTVKRIIGAEDEFIAEIGDALEKIAPARKLTGENYEMAMEKAAKYNLYFMRGSVNRVNEPTKEGNSRALNFTDGETELEYTGWMDPEIERVFPDVCNTAIILLSGMSVNQRNGQTQCNVHGVVPSVFDMKKSSEASGTDHDL